MVPPQIVAYENFTRIFIIKAKSGYSLIIVGEFFDNNVMKIRIQKQNISEIATGIASSLKLLPYQNAKKSDFLVNESL